MKVSSKEVEIRLTRLEKSHDLGLITSKVTHSYSIVLLDNCGRSCKQRTELTSFERWLDLGKEFASSNNLPLLQHAENAVIHYQHMPESSVENCYQLLMISD